MAAIAVAELTLDAPRQVAFSQFIDYAHWDLWLPAQIRPVSGPARALRLGDKLRVSLGPKAVILLELDVIRMREGVEVCWRAGLPGLLSGDHSFFFSDVPGEPEKTRVRGEAPVQGCLTVGPLGAGIERALADRWTALLERFSSYLRAGGARP